MSDTVDLVLEDVFAGVDLASLEGADIELDIADARHQITSLEAHLLDVDTTLKTIAEQGGVSRASIESYGEYLPDEYPLESFTQRPSMTNLNVARVALEDRKGWIIGAIIAAIAALIAKLFSWLAGRNKSESKVESSKAQAVKNLEKVSSSINNLTSTMGNPENPVTAIEKDMSDQGQENWTAYAEMILTRKDMGVKSLFSYQKTIIVEHTKLIQETKEQCERLIKKGGDVNVGDDASMMALKSEVATLEKRFHAYGAMLGMGLNVGVFKGKLNTTQRDELTTPGAVLSSVNAVLEQMQTNSASTKFNVHQFGTDYANKKISLLQDWAPDYDYRYNNSSAKRSLDSLDRVGKDLKHIRVPSFSDNELTAMLSGLLRLMNREVAAIFTYLRILTKMSDTETRYIKMVHEYVQKGLKAT